MSADLALRWTDAGDLFVGQIRPRVAQVLPYGLGSPSRRGTTSEHNHG